MATRRSLADLASAFSSKTTSNDNADWKKFYSFWKMPVDTVATVRFLPDLDEENPMGFLVENFVHELQINGKREKVACLKMYGEACPICELSSRFYDKNSPDHNEDLGKTYYRKKSYIGQVLVVDSPVEHDAEQLVKLIDFGPQVFKQIQAAFQSGDLEAAPYDLKAGYNFRFRKSLTGQGQNSYTTSNFSPKQTPVADDVIEEMKLYNLNDYRAPKVARAAVEAMLLAAQTGGTYTGEDKAESTPATPSKPKATPQPEANDEAEESAPTVTAKVAETPKEEAAPSEGKKLSVVEQLRQRAAAAKAAQAASS